MGRHLLKSKHVAADDQRTACVFLYEKSKARISGVTVSWHFGPTRTQSPEHPGGSISVFR
jgi:hypothetical protein